MAAPARSDVLFETFAITAHPPLALHHRHDGLREVGADHCVALPVTHLLAPFNVRRALAQWPAVEDLYPAIPTAGVALSLLLLAAQVLPQRAPAGLVRVYELVQRLVAYWKSASDLFRAPLQLQQRCGLILHRRCYKRSVAASL